MSRHELAPRDDADLRANLIANRHTTA